MIKNWMWGFQNCRQPYHLVTRMFSVFPPRWPMDVLGFVGFPGNSHGGHRRNGTSRDVQCQWSRSTKKWFIIMSIYNICIYCVYCIHWYIPAGGHLLLTSLNECHNFIWTASLRISSARPLVRPWAKANTSHWSVTWGYPAAMAGWPVWSRFKGSHFEYTHSHIVT